MGNWCIEIPFLFEPGSYLQEMLSVRPVRSTEELKEIIDLQRKYLRGKTSPLEESSEGFLTVAHSLETLAAMHALEPSIVARSDGELAGYALVMHRTCEQLVTVLQPMFNIFPSLFYNGKRVTDYSFYVMGQVCVEKKFRGQGVFDMLYQAHRQRFETTYDFVVTEISTRNLRSMKAHERVGFRTIRVYRDELDEWAVVLWDWRKPA